MRNFTSLFSAITIAMVLPGIGTANAACNADPMCNLNNQNAQSMLADPACKADPNCASCVAAAISSGPAGIQCQAYNSSKKGQSGEIIFASINILATVACGVSCAMSSNLVTSSGEQAWARVCGYAGLAVTGAEIGYTVAQMINGESVDYVGLATTAFGAKSAMATAGHEGAKALGTAVSNTKGAIGKMIANPACLNTVMFGFAAAAKLKSIGKSGGAADEACGNAKVSVNTSGPVLSCLKSPDSPTTPSTRMPGLFSATPETFVVPTINDAKQLAASANLQDALNAVGPDMQMALDQGKLDLGATAKKLAQGSSVSDILAGSQIPPQILDAIKKGEEQMKTADTSKLLAAIGGGGYSGSGTATANAGSDSGTGDLSFGGATPSEGAESLDIDKKSAGTTAAEMGDGDVFHGAYHGTIFDIVTNRLKASKGSYAELDPEGRMNRVFNGYRDTTSKVTRAPATEKNKSAK